MNTKDNVLKALEENKGSYISGEELAGKLGVSRNAIWKAVRDLRENGYEITSVTNKGYNLSKNSNIISVQGIATYIKHREGLDDIEVYDELSSTSLIAKKIAVIDYIEKKVVIARKQTAGRGHIRKKFDSPDGGVYFSVLINPDHIKGISIPLFSAVVVTDVLSSEFEASSYTGGSNDKKIGIKWINSIYKGDKKICGILTESISDMETGEISAYIIGIGIKCGLSNKNRTIAEIVNRFFYPDEYYNGVNIIDKYRDKMMYLYKRVKFSIYGEKKETFFATIIGMDKNGKLVVKKDDGTKVYLDKGYMTV